MIHPFKWRAKRRRTREASEVFRDFTEALGRLTRRLERKAPLVPAGAMRQKSE